VFLQEFFALVVIPDVFPQAGRIDAAVPRLVDRDTVFTIFGADIKTDQVVIFVAPPLVMMVALLDQLVRGPRNRSRHPATPGLPRRRLKRQIRPIVSI